MTVDFSCEFDLFNQKSFVKPSFFFKHLDDILDDAAILRSG